MKIEDYIIVINPNDNDTSTIAVYYEQDVICAFLNDNKSNPIHLIIGIIDKDKLERID